MRRTAQCENFYEHPRAVQRSVRSTAHRAAQCKKTTLLRSLVSIYIILWNEHTTNLIIEVQSMKINRTEIQVEEDLYANEELRGSLQRKEWRKDKRRRRRMAV